jgi:hypothetical protein
MPLDGTLWIPWECWVSGQCIGHYTDDGEIHKAASPVPVKSIALVVAVGGRGMRAAAGLLHIFRLTPSIDRERSGLTRGVPATPARSLVHSISFLPDLNPSSAGCRQHGVSRRLSGSPQWRTYFDAVCYGRSPQNILLNPRRLEWAPQRQDHRALSTHSRSLVE